MIIKNKCLILITFDRDGLEDPLDDLGMILQQLEQVSVIARCDYQKTCALLVQIFDQSASLYQELLNSPTALPMDITIQEGKMRLLYYFQLIISRDFFFLICIFRL